MKDGSAVTLPSKTAGGRAWSNTLTATVISIIHLLAVKKKGGYMSLAIQKGFWQDAYLANTRQKLAELYQKNPDIAESEKRVILEYWKAYDGLSHILGDKLTQFTSWFFKSTFLPEGWFCL